MPFSILLLVAANPNRHISGEGKDSVTLENVKSGELVLFFDKLDSDKVGKALNMLDEKGQKKQCCDGLIFYTCNGEDEKTLCLVEMKSGSIKKAEDQLISTYGHLSTMLRNTCQCCEENLLSKIKWKAFIYRRCSSPEQTDRCKEKLKKSGLSDVEISHRGDIGPFLRDHLPIREKYKGKKAKRAPTKYN